MIDAASRYTGDTQLFMETSAGEYCGETIIEYLTRYGFYTLVDKIEITYSR